MDCRRIGRLAVMYSLYVRQTALSFVDHHEQLQAQTIIMSDMTRRLSSNGGDPDGLVVTVFAAAKATGTVGSSFSQPKWQSPNQAVRSQPSAPSNSASPVSSPPVNTGDGWAADIRNNSVFVPFARAVDQGSAAPALAPGVNRIVKWTSQFIAPRCSVGPNHRDRYQLSARCCAAISCRRVIFEASASRNLAA